MGLLLGTKRALLAGYPATRYFVDATLGNDANDGKSPDLAWQTIAKVNGETFRPTDHILFKRGETWVGSWLIVPDGGTAGNPIIFGAYGSGNNPVIDTCQEYNDFILDAGAIWERTWTVDQLNQVFEDGVRLTRAVNKVAMVAGTFFHDDPADLIYVWCSDSGNPNTEHVVEHAATWRGSFDFNGKSNIIVDGIDIKRSDLSGFRFRQVADSTNLILRNCNSSWHATHGFDCGGYGVLNLDNIAIENCTAFDQLHSGFWIGNGSNITLSNCEAYNAAKDYDKGYAGDSGLGTGILVGIRSVDCIVEDCYVHNAYVDNCIFVEHEIGYDRPSGTVVRRNHCDGNVSTAELSAVVKLEGSNTLCENNVIEASASNALQVANTASGEEIYHNTIYLTTNGSWGFALVSGSNIIVKNNIVVSSIGAMLIGSWTNCRAGLDVDYNSYSAGNGEEYFWQGGIPEWPNTLADWRTVSGQDADTLNSDPQFVTPGSDFHLQVGSPCRGAGAIDTGVTDDYDGVARPDPPTQPDIGAYEYVA